LQINAKCVNIEAEMEPGATKVIWRLSCQPGRLSDPARPQVLDVVGLAEVAMILGVEKPRIGKWRRLGIVTVDGERIPFPTPIAVGLSAARKSERLGKGWDSLAATRLWWADDIRALAVRIRRRSRPRGDQ
jgi:hypothetical protein